MRQSTHPARRRPHPAFRPAAGFTLFEVTLTMLVVVMVLTGVLVLFDFNSQLARAQTHVANMQQSLRVAQYDMLRYVRMTGRGPLPPIPPPGGATADEHDLISVAVRNNVDPDSHIAIGNTNSPELVPGTDVLTVRGVFNSPLYQVNPTGGVFTLNGEPPSGGTLIIGDKTPTGIPHDLEPFRDILDRAESEALLVVSPLDDFLYAVVEIDPQTSSYTEESGVITQVTIEFDITGGDYTNEFNAISAGGSYPATMTTAAFAGILEEYRYYIREMREIPGDDTSRLSPRLSRARFYPGTEVAHLADVSNFQADIADNILDLQVALGIDTATMLDDVILENDPPDADDEWLFNSAGDDATNTAKWIGLAPDLAKLFYVRVNTLARTDRQDRGTEADLLGLVEDKDYSSSPGLEYNSGDQRAFRRRWMQTIVDMRNVS